MPNGDTLYILWTTGDAKTAEHMVFMYAGNSLRYKWWEKVHIIVWGAAAELLVTNDDIKREMVDFLHLGGEVSVCLKCLENINRVDEMKAMAVENTGKFKIFYVGEFFTRIIKDREHLISV